MSDHTPIHWADGTCNPTMGCDGCELWNATRRSCYAGEQHVTFGAVRRGYSPTFGQITYWPGRMAEAASLADLRGYRRPDKPWLNGMPRLIFISDMGDALCDSGAVRVPPHGDHRERSGPAGPPPLLALADQAPKRMAEFSAWLAAQGIPWPSNLWAGTSVTTAATTYRIDQLLNVGGDETIRFLSVEPQLERLDLRPWLPCLDWIIQGGESGSLERRFDVAWAQELYGQCQEAETPYFLKQLGGYVFRGEDRIRLLERHGGDWNEWPEGVPGVRQMPMSPLGERQANNHGNESVRDSDSDQSAAAPSACALTPSRGCAAVSSMDRKGRGTSAPRAGSWCVEKLSPDATSVHVSRRTDIPAFFGEWFKHRLTAGFAEYIPMRTRKRYRCSLLPEEVIAFRLLDEKPETFPAGPGRGLGGRVSSNLERHDHRAGRHAG